MTFSLHALWGALWLSFGWYSIWHYFSVFKGAVSNFSCFNLTWTDKIINIQREFPIGYFPAWPLKIIITIIILPFTESKALFRLAAKISEIRFWLIFHFTDYFSAQLLRYNKNWKHMANTVIFHAFLLHLLLKSQEWCKSDSEKIRSGYICHISSAVWTKPKADVWSGAKLSFYSTCRIYNYDH